MSDLDFFDFEPGEQRQAIEPVTAGYGIRRDQLHSANDPFNAGTSLDWDKADWLNSLYILAGRESFNGHLRDLHYKANALRPDLYDASDESWERLMEAKALAVALGVIPPDALDDRSISRSFDVRRDTPELIESMEEIQVPSVGTLAAPLITTPHPAALLPFDIVFWGEKPSPALEAEINPACARFGADIRYGRGNPGQSFVGHLSRNAADSERELVVVVLSDADTSGIAMPAALARQLEIVVRGNLIEGMPRVRVVRAGITMEMIEQIEQRIGREIPRTTDQKTGEDRIELQALPAFVPGELGRIVEDAFVSIVGPDFLDALDDWERDLEQQLAEAEESAEIEQLHGEYGEFLRTPEAVAVIERLQAFEDRRRVLTQALAEMIEDADPVEVEEPPTDWLLDSDRSFLDQAQAYRRHAGEDEFEFEMKTCGWCGGPITQGRSHRRFCSEQCRSDFGNDAKKVVNPQRACEHCGTLFTPKRSDSLTCSRDCSHKRRAKRRSAQRGTESRVSP